MDDRCEIPGCRGETAVTYLGHGVCSNHWHQLTNENAPDNALKVVLGVSAGHELTMEVVMSKKTKTEKSAEPKPTKAVKKKAPREKVDRTGFRTLALRVSPQDFDRIHAGAKKAGETLTAFMFRNVSAAC